jgi:hypothetical protein
MRGRLKRGFDLVLLVYPGEDSLAGRRDQLRVLCSKGGLLCPAAGLEKGSSR